MSKDYSETDRVWELLKISLTRFLEQRTETILKHYSIDLTPEAYNRLAREEKFVELSSDFLNECESYVNVHRNKINELVAENEEDKRYIGAIADALNKQIEENMNLVDVILRFSNDPRFKEKKQLLEAVKESFNEQHKKQAPVI